VQTRRALATAKSSRVRRARRPVRSRACAHRPPPPCCPARLQAIAQMFKSYDTDASGSIDLAEFTEMVLQLGVAPKKLDAGKELEGKGKAEMR
jgi:hypothetical protein